MEQEQVVVWTIEWYEGRFLQWEGASWLAFDYRNYRNWFSAPQTPTHQDVAALRAAFEISAESLAEDQLPRTSPSALENWRPR